MWVAACWILSGKSKLYVILSRIKYLKQICICLVVLKKYFENILHDKIIEQYPFSSCYDHFLLRWLSFCFIFNIKNHKNLEQNK